MCVVSLVTVMSVMVSASVSAAQDKLAKKYTETVAAKDGTKYSIDMALVPGGEFTMGSPSGEADRAVHGVLP